MSHLTKYTHKPISVRARVIGIFIKEKSSEARKRKRRSQHNKPPIKRRVFILEDVYSVTGISLLEHSFIYDENVDEFKDVKPGDTITFEKVNFYAFGKPDFEHDGMFQLEYSHNIEFTSENIRSISTDATNKYMLIDKALNKVYLYPEKFDMQKYKILRNLNESITVITNTDVWKDLYKFEIVSESKFVALAKKIQKKKDKEERKKWNA